MSHTSFLGSILFSEHFYRSLWHKIVTLLLEFMTFLKYPVKEMSCVCVVLFSQMKILSFLEFFLILRRLMSTWWTYDAFYFYLSIYLDPTLSILLFLLLLNLKMWWWVIQIKDKCKFIWAVSFEKRLPKSSEPTKKLNTLKVGTISCPIYF